MPPRVVEEAGPPPDCKPMRASDGPAWKPYKERRVDEGQTYADAGVALLISAEGPDQPIVEKQKKIEASVQKFFLSLAADPYNIHATYNLAAAYARIGRKQCALNLLARMAEMSSFPSQRAHVLEHADRLFGRGKFKGRPDPDFDKLRPLEEFAQIVSNLK
jgi:hypothetical protein